MHEVLYEAAFKPDMGMFILGTMLCLIPAMPAIIKKSCLDRAVEVNLGPVKIFCAAAFLCVALMAAVVGWGQAQQYRKTVHAYKNGAYETVEGTVENFKPYVRGEDESFEIEGVRFAYNDYDLQPGYNTVREKGGVITGNGQRLRVNYVPYGEDNLIMRIEQLP